MWGITPGSIRLNDALVVVHGAISEDRTGSLFAFLYWGEAEDRIISQGRHR
jgi:hypothetical protein